MTTVITIDSLPAEILSEVISFVKLASGSVSALQPCLLVCRKWNILTLPYFYGNIVLDASNFELFAEQFNLAYAPFVKFLTLRFAPLPSTAKQAQVLTEKMSHLPLIITSLANLASFSFSIPFEDWAKWNQMNQFDTWGRNFRPEVSPELLISLVEALPKSCVNLEIDMGRFCLQEFSTLTSPHICDSLRRVLPRMRRVRLHLSTTCSALFEDDTPLSDSKQKAPTPKSISLPNMETLVVNCNRYSYWKLSDSFIGLCRNPRQSAWNSVTKALQRLVTHSESHREDAELVVIGSVPFSSAEKTAYVTLTNTNMTTSTTWAMPIYTIRSAADWGMRTIGGGEWIGDPWALENLAENATWVQVVGGAKIPAALLNKKKKSALVETFVTENPLAVRDSNSWRAEHTDKSIRLWEKESESGTKLLEAEERVGKKTFLLTKTFSLQLPIYGTFRRPYG